MTEYRAEALLASAFPDLKVVEVIYHDRSAMTDVANPEMPNPSEGWGEEPEAGQTVAQAPVIYPEHPSNPHNHRYTLSYDPQKPPFLVVRANTAEELKASFQELEDGGVYAAMGNAWRVMKAQASVGAGLGPTTPVPDVPGVPAAPMPPAPHGGVNYNPQMPPPGIPGQAPAAWQNAGAPTPPAPQGGFNGGQQAGNRGPKPRPNWAQVYKITVPFQQKEQFKAYREQYKDAFKGKLAWAGGGDYWVDGAVVQSFANYTPVPA